MLLAKGLWGFVDGTEELDQEANAQAQADFRRRSQKTFSTIIMAISTPQLYLVTSCEHPGEVWEALQNHFDRDTLANKLFLKKQYFCTEVTLLGSLPRSYSTLVTALEACCDDITLKFVQQSLIHKKQKINVHPSGDTLPGGQKPTALVGVQGKAKPQKPKCFGCGQPGHFRGDCPKRTL